MDLSKYKLTSRLSGGQYSGPCMFTNQGRDRFTLEPMRGRWFCRKCSNSCTEGWDDGNYRHGFINSEDKEVYNMPEVKAVSNTITYDDAIGFAQNLNQQGLKYLRSRGLNEATVSKFHLGMNSNQTAISIPCTYTWSKKNVCPGIKFRFLPEYESEHGRYTAQAGSKTKAVFNFNALSSHEIFGIVANSLFDVMLIDQLGYPVVGPFAGEASWDKEWSKFINWDCIINLGDRDAPNADGLCPGEQYMLQRSLLFEATNVINTLAPEPYTDINAAYMDGFDIIGWLSDTLERGYK